jgi:hypothetical protein
MSTAAAHLLVFRKAIGRREPAPAGRSDTLEELLAPERWLRQGRADAELKKAFGFIQAELGETRRLLSLPGDETSTRSPATVEELRSLLRGDVERLSIDGAWELHGALKRLNLRLGDASYVAAQLDYEQHRPVHDWHGWKRHFAPAELRRLVARFDDETVTPADHRRAVDRLTVLYLMRAEAGRNRRARAALKCDYLHRLAPLLLLLVAALGIAFHLATGGTFWKLILLTATAGALGSTLSGVFKVRDQLARLDELRGFWPTMHVQPFTGACAGLIVLLMLESKAIAFDSFNADSPSPATLALLAFAAGFSEPFFLGIVQKVAVIPDPKPASPAAPKQNPA